MDAEGESWVSAYRPAVSDGPAYNTPGVTSGSHFQGENLGRVEPGYC